MLEEEFQQFEKLTTALVEELKIFTPELKASLAAFAVEAADRGKTDPYITRLDSLERKRGPALWGDYLRAHLSGATQHLDHWERDMMKVADRLLQGNGFSQAVEIAQEILQEHPTAAGARILVRGAEGLGDKERLEDALEQAWAVDPGNARTAMRLAQLARERGDIPTSLEWTGSALKGLASEDDWTQLDECMVTIFDGEEPTSHISAIDILPELFRNGLEDKAREYLDLGLQRWQKEPYCGRLFETLREMLERGMASDELQPALRATMESRFGECPELQNFLSLSCLCLEGADYPACFKTWDTLWAYRPSVVVEHNSLGLGTLASNDGERLLINFEKKPGHSMTLAFAQKSLTVLAPGHLKAQIALDRNGVMDRFKEDPASIVVAILGDLGGSAKGADVKKYLVYVGLPVTAFAAWWKKAKAAAEKHPRLDTHEAYRDVMHLLKEGADGIGRSMPVLEVKKGPKSAWTLLKRFLSQHPTALDEARRRYRPYFEGWAMMPEINTMERAAAVMVLARWFPDLKQFWTPMARELDLAVLDVPNWSSELDQELWFELLAGSEDWSEVLPLFLGSKRPQVRARARRELSARWGDREAQELRKLLERAGEIPAVAVALCTEALNSDPLPPWAEPWRLAMAIISVLGGKAPETVHQECLRAIDPNEGRLVTLVQSKPGESLASSLGSLLRHWRTSDSFLFQVFAFLNKTPATDLVTDAEAFRTEALRRLEIPTGDQAENDSILMSRSTFDRMVYDLERMDRELKTSIPDAIRKARELGDLRENAEYDAAKLKQRQTTERCEQLQKAITSVRIIEDLPISEEKAGPGTEVEMQSATGPRSVWIMGEGDNHLGENVTSYRAALGKILSGVKVGEKVTLKEDSGEVEYTVKKIRKRLPEGATA